MWRREYHFAVIHIDETTPHLIRFGAVDRRESIGERRDRRPENAQDAEKFLEAMQKGASAIARLGRRKQFNGLDQKLYER